MFLNKNINFETFYNMIRNSVQLLYQTKRLHGKVVSGRLTISTIYKIDSIRAFINQTYDTRK